VSVKAAGAGADAVEFFAVNTDELLRELLAAAPTADEHGEGRPADRSSASALDASGGEVASGEPKSSAVVAKTQSAGGGRPSQATLLVELATREVTQFFHTADGAAYADIQVDGHRETWSLRSSAFADWLSARFWKEHGKGASRTAIQTALATLAGIARFDGPELPVHTRIAGSDERIWIDLGNPTWEAVEITPAGYQVVAEPPVRFRRARGALALPTPLRGGDVNGLRRFLNVDDDGWVLALGWLAAALRPKGPYPVLVVSAEQGSGKSTLARVLRALIDPFTAPLRAQPREERDLAIAANNSWAVVFDNLSYLPPALSDALCRLATGGGFATRQLYTDDEEMLFDAMRPVLLNGIGELATRGDLLDRSLLLRLPPIPEAERRTELRFWDDFAQALPYILGALYTAVAQALRDFATVQLAALPRMADITQWVTVAEPALGLEPGTFLHVYRANRGDANETALAAWPLARSLIAIAQGGFEGTMTDLLDRLFAVSGDDLRRSRSWPKTAGVLSNQLNRYAPNLRGVGIEIDRSRDSSNDRTKRIGIRQSKRQVETVQSVQSATFDWDLRGREMGAAELKMDAPDAPDAPNGPNPLVDHEADPMLRAADRVGLMPTHPEVREP